MIIDPNNSINTQSFGAGKARQQTAEAPGASRSDSDAKSPASSGDSVSLSSASRAIASLENRVRESSDVDTARVAQVKQAVDSGSYQIDARAIADKIASEDSIVG